MRTIEDAFLTALTNDRALLRKMPHWHGVLNVGPIRCGDGRIDYVALAAERFAPDAEEVALVESVSRLDPEDAEFALPSAARWGGIKRIDLERLRGPAEPAFLTIDGARVPASAWEVAPYRLVVAVQDGRRYEVWTPSRREVELVPLGTGDTFDLGMHSPVSGELHEDTAPPGRPGSVDGADRRGGGSG